MSEAALALTVVLLSLTPLIFSRTSQAQPRQQGISVSDKGDGIGRVVTVESDSQFRLGFELASNAGLSEWYDLVNDPSATVCLTATPNNGRPGADQGALFNQVFNPDDLIAHSRIAAGFHKDVPRSVTVLESGPARAVVVCKYHPMFSHVNASLQLTTTYTIYATGRIGIRNELLALDDQELTEWRNSTVTLGDPFYSENLDSGRGNLMPDGKTFAVSGRAWMPDQWAGFELDQDPYISYEIAGNTKDTLSLGSKLNGVRDLSTGIFSISARRTKFGWLRKDNRRRWDGTADFFFEYWDPLTPAPYKDWTSASVLLVPAPDNPHQGTGPNTHEWPGTKRFYFVEGKFKLAKGQSVTQFYEMQLGARNSKLMPAIESADIASNIARSYRQPPKLVGFGFDKSEACYTAMKSGVSLSLDVPAGLAAGDSHLLKPAIRFAAAGTKLNVLLNGKPLAAGRDFICQRSEGTWILLFLEDLQAGDHIAIQQSP